MTPNQIVEVLKSRGWTAEIINRSDVDDLVDEQKVLPRPADRGQVLGQLEEALVLPRAADARAARAEAGGARLLEDRHLHPDAAEAERLLVDVAADVALDEGWEVVEVAVVAAPFGEVLVEGRAELPDEREREQRGEAEEDDRERKEDERRHPVRHERHRLHRHRRRAVRRRRGEQ